MERFENCYGLCFGLVPKEQKIKVIKHFISILKEEVEEYKVLTWETVFFKAKYLINIPEEERQLIKTHLISRLEKEISFAVLNSMEGIGKYLKTDEANKFIDILIKEILYGKNKLIKDRVKEFFIKEEDNFEEEASYYVLKRLDSWNRLFEVELKKPELAQIIQDLKGEIIYGDDLL